MYNKAIAEFFGGGGGGAEGKMGGFAAAHRKLYIYIYHVNVSRISGKGEIKPWSSPSSGYGLDL